LNQLKFDSMHSWGDCALLLSEANIYPMAEISLNIVNCILLVT